MDANALRSLQAPLKERYREQPQSARITLKAQGSLDGDGLTCSVETGRALVEAGLHPSGGGTGLQACSGDMLLQALVACAGVTLRAVATSLEFPLRGGTVRAEGVVDVRGTLAVNKDTPVGFESIALHFDLETDAPPAQIETLLKLTERYCIVYQTLRGAPTLTLSHHVPGA